jgi:endoglycosylceramidase
MRRLAALLSLVVAGCGGSGNPSSGSAGLTSLELLHSVRGANPGIYDEQDRQVILRGVNYNVLGDYYQQVPQFATTIAPADSDMPRMAQIGLNSIRLVLNWSAIEPQPGSYDEAYLDRVRAQVERAQRYGIYVILDMHQDKWGKFIATPPGDSCTPPTLPATGWDGAPEWATDTGGLSTCYIVSGEIAPAVAAAFNNFYNDKNGIQTRFVAMWAHVAGEFARYRNVAGYDLFNEPNPGFLPVIAGVTYEAKLYARLIPAIRDAERSAPGGLAHVIFFEPGAEWSLLGNDATPPASFTDDGNIAFAPHGYCGSIAVDPNIEDCFKNAQTHAAAYQTTFWTGEWGFFGDDPSTFAAAMKQFGQFEDQYLVGGAQWQWEQACGDPNTLSSVGAQPPAVLYHLNAVQCPDSVPIGFVSANEIVVSRSYPRAAPGQITLLQSDADTGTLTVEGTTGRAGTADLWFPDRGLGAPQVSGDNLSAVKVTAVDGGYRIRCTVNGTYRIHVVAANAP